MDLTGTRESLWLRRFLRISDAPLNVKWGTLILYEIVLVDLKSLSSYCECLEGDSYSLVGLVHLDDVTFQLELLEHLFG